MTGPVTDIERVIRNLVPQRGAEHLCELGRHPRTAHRPSTSVGQFSHVDRSRHVGVAMPEQERDLVNTLPSPKRPAGDGVTPNLALGQ